MRRRNALLCFVDDITNSDEFDKFISKFEDKGFEIHVLNGIVENHVQPHDIIPIIEAVFAKEIETYNLYFLTNIEDFFVLIYRIYHQLFKQFIFFAHDRIDYDVSFEGVYKMLLQKDIIPDENIVKPIFVNKNCVNINHQLIRCFSVPLKDVNDLFVITDDIKPMQKYYCFNKRYFLFEPVDGDEITIFLDSEDSTEPIRHWNTHIFYPNLEIGETIHLLERIDESKNNFFQLYKYIQDHFGALEKIIANSSYFAKKFYLRVFEVLSRSFGVYVKIFIYSFLLNISLKTKYYNWIYSLLIDNKELTKEEKYFYLYQCIRLGFVRQGIANDETAVLQRRLYRDIYISFKKRVEGRYRPIPKEERNKNLVVVMISQFLSLHHAPTKTALDRCYSLMKHLGKQVVLINTKELLTTKGMCPFYNIITGNEVKELEKFDRIKYKDVEIPFYQPSIPMPDIQEIVRIADEISRLRPYFIIHIGGTSITVDLCSQIVPTANISTVFSGLPLSEGQMYVIGRKTNIDDICLLDKFGFGKENIIESVFTFDFKPQQHYFTRKQLNLPEHKFLIAVVGARLDEEVTDEFVKLMMETIDLEVHFVFIGCFERYYDWIAKNPILMEHTTYLGFQDDVLAVLELCDLYVNPKRAGGGSSAAEAMYKGLPVVTINIGDVAVVAGNDFCVNSYEEMQQMIERYVRDQDFYNEMSQKARQRAEIVLSTNQQIQRIVDKIVNNQFFY
ncbi:hypothetical protein GT50_07445 [Geobacillus stearothermophilus 10]|nr:hypothetical protein GT50_07445 [Geobacillus stearothermophilus 10]